MKTICIDIDGTICAHDGWKGEEHFGQVLPYAKDVITRLHNEGWTIIIHTAREESGYIENFLKDNGIPFDAINENPKFPHLKRSGKPLADIYVDDRAVQFKGCWHEVYEEIQRFRPWHKTVTEKISLKLPVFLDSLTAYDRIDEMYVCGGYIRDYLIGGELGKDIDVFIDCSPEQLADFTRYLSSYGRVEYGQYGSPRFYPSEGEDGYYIDIVPFYNFIVSDEPVTSVDELLHNFDFSANALAWDIKRGVLHDPENGSSDISKRILRAVRTDFPEKKVSAEIDLSTNTVFWFRLLHFQHRLGFSFDVATEKWIIANRHRFSDLEKFEQHFFTPCISDEMRSKLSIGNVH